MNHFSLIETVGDCELFKKLNQSKHLAKFKQLIFVNA